MILTDNFYPSRAFISVQTFSRFSWKSFCWLEVIRVYIYIYVYTVRFRQAKSIESIERYRNFLPHPPRRSWSLDVIIDRSNSIGVNHFMFDGVLFLTARIPRRRQVRPSRGIMIVFLWLSPSRFRSKPLADRAPARKSFVINEERVTRAFSQWSRVEKYLESIAVYIYIYAHTSRI